MAPLPVPPEAPYHGAIFYNKGKGAARPPSPGLLDASWTPTLGRLLHLRDGGYAAPPTEP